MSIVEAEREYVKVQRPALSLGSMGGGLVAVSIETGASLDSRGPVRGEWFRAYERGENRTPNTIIAIGIFVGNAAMQSLQEGVSVRSFIASGSFNEKQMGKAIPLVVRKHSQFQVEVFPEGQVPDGIKKAKTFKHEKLSTVYREGVDNIMRAIATLCLPEVAKRADPQEVVPIVERFLHEPDNLAATASLFSTAAMVLDKPEVTELTDAYTQKIRGKKSKGFLTRQREILQLELMPFLAKPMIEAGRAHGINETQVANFILTITNPELSNSA